MAALPPLYRKAARRRRTLTGHSQLWMGPGHLLLLKSTHFAEEYQRFTFASIQSIVATEVPFNAAPRIAGLLALAAALWLGYGRTPFGATAEEAIAALLGGAFVIALMVDVARGARCRCVLQTAVSRQILPVTRMRVARKLLGRLTPEIEAAQGALTPERAAEMESAELLRAEVSPPAVPIAESRVPWVLFGIFLLNAGLAVLDLMFPRSQASSAIITVLPAELALTLYLLLKPAPTTGRRARSWTRAVASLALVCLLVDGIFLLSIGVGWIIAMTAASRGSGLPLPAPFTSILPTPFPWFRPGWRIAAGLLGLAAAWWERGQGSSS